MPNLPRIEAAAAKLTTQLASLDEQLESAVAKAKLPIPGLALTNDGVALKGVPFEQASGSGEAASIRRDRIRPEPHPENHVDPRR